MRLQPSVVQNVTTYSVIIDVPNRALKLKPGMTANVAIEVAARDNVVRVPNAALRFRPTAAMFAALGQEAPSTGQTTINAETAEHAEVAFSARSARSALNVVSRDPKATTVDALFGPLEVVETEGRVWVYADNRLKPLRVRLGVSDGQTTELIEGDLQPDTALVTNVTTGAEIDDGGSVPCRPVHARWRRRTRWTRRTGRWQPARRIAMTFRIAFKALGRNKMRTGLTMLGMIIGVAAVITLVAMGNGAQSAIEDQIKGAGTNMITVNAGNFTSGGVRQGSGASSSLTVEDAEAIRNEIAGAQYSRPASAREGRWLPGTRTGARASRARAWICRRFAPGRCRPGRSSRSRTSAAPRRSPCSARPSTPSCSGRMRTRWVRSSGSASSRSR